ncbi:MAG: type II toxin-antitoxin system RelE/ParE family toxin [Bifidobacteriaceae bacterium]|jgi:mRNA-degrading endonuclease RelE of RelBE toxin-antitoxin system|nr:type II toxin-antitoxin system RelE/ParE family toxin [Bifidobacteriaceae bacterium]
MKVTLSRLAKKQLKRLSAENSVRVGVALGRLAKDPPEGDIKPVRKMPRVFRSRAGDYRIFFEKRVTEVFIIKIRPRGQAYK